jgi:hypothetical protein
MREPTASLRARPAPLAPGVWAGHAAGAAGFSGRFGSTRRAEKTRLCVTGTETASLIAGPPLAEGSFPSTTPEPAGELAEPPAGHYPGPALSSPRRHR